MVNIAKPPPSNFIWPPLCEEAKFPIAAPLYVAPPETQRFTAKPCTYRPLVKPPQRLSVQNLRQVESQQTQQEPSPTTTENECLNVESNITATTSTSNASSESEYKMYQTQNNHYANMFEQTKEVDDEVEEINNPRIIVDLRKTPPPIELPKNIKNVEFVEPESTYKAETYSSVFSNRKETWQKLTSTSVAAKREEVRVEFVEANDDNPENSDEDQIIRREEDNKAEDEDDNEENDVEAEIKGQHVGPYDGSYYQLPPSNIPQPTPKLYRSDFQKALITTSERPYQIHDVAPTPEPKIPNLDFYEEAIREAENYPVEEEKPKKVKKEIPKFEVKTTSRKCEFPYEDRDVRQGSGLMSAMMRTASPKPMEFVKSNVIEEVDLPDESDAYFPPPISMEPRGSYGTIESYRTKSPFVGALTTGPDRPYTPFGREIMSQLSMDIPSDTRKITFSNALHTAPDDSFDPSSLEYDFDPVEYTAKVYEKITVEPEADMDDASSTSSAFARVDGRTSEARLFLPTIQPWSVANPPQPENSYTDSFCCQEAAECRVSDSRRGSQMDRRRSSVITECPCDSRYCSKFLSEAKQLSELLKTKVNEEEEFDAEKPNPNAIYPKRNQQPSPFEGMQVKVTNKMTSSLHKSDGIPDYQRKWYKLATQNPPKTPEPEELRENVPMAFHEWGTSANCSRRSSISAVDQQAAIMQRHEPVRSSIAEMPMSSKPPIPVESSSVSASRRSSISESRREVKRLAEEAEDEFEQILFPTSSRPAPQQHAESFFPTKNNRDDESEKETIFPTTRLPPAEGTFPTRGIRKNSLADLPQRQKVQFEKQRDLRQELRQQTQKMQQKQKIRQQKELEALNPKSFEQPIESQVSEQPSTVIIGEKIQKNQRLSAYEQEMEYKRQLELERQQSQKEKELKEQQEREREYQRRMEESRVHEIKMKQHREQDLQDQTRREMEYRKIRDEQDDELRRQQEQRDAELRQHQEDIETELRRQNEREKRMTEAREAQRLFEIRRKEERDRELERIEAELREKREEELKTLQREIREKREQRKREEIDSEKRRIAEQFAHEEAEREQRRLEDEAARTKRELEQNLQKELKMRQKQEADRKQREEMELFNIEEERKYNETHAYTSSTYQQQTVWPPNSKPPTPAPSQTPRPVPIIKTDSETELNATKFRFEPLDEDQRRFMAGIRPPSTCYSPPTENKPFPSIPYYQQHLVFEEAEPTHCGIFNPKALSPAPNRSRSPAFGPPPNPLRAFVNKARDPELDESGIYLCGERLLSPIWYEKQQKQIPPAVQRKHILLGGPNRPKTPQNQADMSSLAAAIKKHQEDSGTRAPPPPPPMPKQRPSQRKIDDTNEDQEPVTSTDMPPKGIVARTVRRLSGDASKFSIRPSITVNDENSSQSFASHERDARKVSRQNDFYDNRHETRQTTTTTTTKQNFNASSSTSSHQLTHNNANYSSQSCNQQHFMGQSLASASFQNSQMNPNSVDNVRVSTGSVGQPGALPKHGRTFTTTGPNRGQGVLTQPSTGRIPVCGACACQVRLVMGSNPFYVFLDFSFLRCLLCVLELENVLTLI